MKKIFFLFMLLFPYIIYAEDVNIESVEIYNNDGVEIVNKATGSGLDLNMDLKFKEVGSSITYKVVLKNTSSDVYEIEEKTITDQNEHVEYTYNCDGDNLIKSRKSKTCYVKLQM